MTKIAKYGVFDPQFTAFKISFRTRLNLIYNSIQLSYKNPNHLSVSLRLENIAIKLGKYSYSKVLSNNNIWQIVSLE